MTQLYFNKHEVAAQLGVSEFTVRRLARDNKGIGFRMHGTGPWRFSAEDIKALAAVMRAPRQAAS